MTPDRIVEALRRVAFHFSNELDLQDGIAIALKRAGIEHTREVALTKRDRIDFMAGDVGIEVKIDGSITLLTRQLFRYAQLPEVNSLVVVVTRMRLANLPSEINGKPVLVVRVIPAFS